MFGLNLTQIGISAIAGALCLTAVFLAGNHYGSNALWRQHREAEDKAKNDAITYLNRQENENGLLEDKRLLDADKEFTATMPTLGLCTLTAEQVGALNTTGN